LKNKDPNSDAFISSQKQLRIKKVDLRYLDILSDNQLEYYINIYAIINITRYHW